MEVEVREKQMKAYSMDIRQKIVETYRLKEGSIRQIAYRFKVAKSFVQTLIKRDKTQHSLEPLPHGGGRAAKLAGHLETVKEIVSQNNDATLEELCCEMEAQIGLRVNGSTLSRFLKQHQITRKKNSARHRSGNGASPTFPTSILAIRRSKKSGKFSLY